jgi:hypothetical protein
MARGIACIGTLLRIFESIEAFYSGNSCHSSLGFVSLTLFLRDRLNAQQAKETAG